MFNPGLGREGTEVTCDFDCATQEDLPESECLALQALYNSTNGLGWANNDLWLDHRNPCGWHGVNCSGGSVYTLDLSDNNLIGTIPPQIGDLKWIMSLKLQDNNLSGPVPVELTHLNKLQYLFLYNNNISGGIPAELGSVCKLVNCQMAQNDFSGVLPPELGALHNLVYLGLGWNNLHGPIPPEFGRLTRLENLELQVNYHIDGPIPKELGELTNLKILDLSINDLGGTIPVELTQLDQLRGMDLAFNNLGGRMPDEFGNLTNLTHLRLTSNPLLGSLPVSMTSLTELYRFGYTDTFLCAPLNSSYNNWEGGIEYLDTSGTNCNTQVGSDVLVRPEDINNQGSSQVEVTYKNITNEGHTYLAITETIPDPPTGFRIGELPLLYYDITSTATFDQAEICIQDNNLFNIPNARLIIEHYNQSTDNWDELQTEVIRPDNNPANMEVCTVVEQLDLPE